LTACRRKLLAFKDSEHASVLMHKTLDNTQKIEIKLVKCSNAPEKSIKILKYSIKYSRFTDKHLQALKTEPGKR